MGLPMLPAIPEDAIDFIRGAFAQANTKATLLLSRQPSIHEEGIDFHLISSLDEIGPRLMSASGAAVEILTHWLGGRRHFGHWEIADIAIVVIVRRFGTMLGRKVALLQSKRLYSREIPVTPLDRSDYLIGIGRLVDRTEPLIPLSTQRAFAFTEDCVFGALTAGSEQAARIDQYMQARGLPVYYSLYNPSRMPFSGMVPRLATEPEDTTIETGCRILAASDVHAMLATLPVGKSPSFAELIVSPRPDLGDCHSAHGYRLETFVADEVLRCRQGRLFEDSQDQDLRSLLYGRTAPIAAAVVVTIDLPDGS